MKGSKKSIVDYILFSLLCITLFLLFHQCVQEHYPSHSPSVCTHQDTPTTSSPSLWQSPSCELHEWGIWKVASLMELLQCIKVTPRTSHGMLTLIFSLFFFYWLNRHCWKEGTTCSLVHTFPPYLKYMLLPKIWLYSFFFYLCKGLIKGKEMSTPRLDDYYDHLFNCF